MPPVNAGVPGSIELGPYNKILLLGGSELLRDLCLWAQANTFDVSVVTEPRHGEETVEGISLLEFLTQHKIRHLCTESITAAETKAFIGDTRDTFCLSVCGAWIFKPDLIESVFKNRLFNTHGAGVPQNRGGGGFSWQILTANRFGFSVIHFIDGGVDTGDIVLMKEFLFPAACRTGADYATYHKTQNFKAITDFVGKMRSAPLAVKPQSQSEHLSSYWPRLHTPTNAWIDWEWPAEAVERFICAFDDPYVGAQTFWKDKKVHLKKASLNLQDAHFHPYQAGLIYRKSNAWLCVACNGASVVIEAVLDDSGKNILADIKAGDRFITPSANLDAMKQRVIYTPAGLKSSP